MAIESKPRVTGWRLIGGAYKSCGSFIPGCTLVYVEGREQPYYFSENTSLNEALRRLDEQGVIDAHQFQSDLDEWVKTGKFRGSAVTLNLHA